MRQLEQYSITKVTVSTLICSGQKGRGPGHVVEAKEKYGGNAFGLEHGRNVQRGSFP